MFVDLGDILTIWLVLTMAALFAGGVLFGVACVVGGALYWLWATVRNWRRQRSEHDT